MKKLFLLLLTSTSLIIACDSSPSIDPEGKIELNKGDKKSWQVNKETLSIKLLDIQDSRCPTGVNCIRAGEVIVSLDVNFGNFKNSETQLCIGCESNMNIPEMIKIDSHILKLSDVLPYPDINNQNAKQAAHLIFQ